MPSGVVLCVDDRSEMLRIRQANLERLGFTVATASTATVALSVLETKAVVAVLLDYKTEGLDPEAIAFYVKQRYPQVPIVLLSAYSDVPERILWLVDEYLLRSESLERLTDILDRFSHSHASLAVRAAS